MMKCIKLKEQVGKTKKINYFPNIEADPLNKVPLVAEESVLLNEDPAFVEAPIPNGAIEVLDKNGEVVAVEDVASDEKREGVFVFGPNREPRGADDDGWVKENAEGICREDFGANIEFDPKVGAIDCSDKI
jgi:hypothetical protein